jgi:hypothetical protein
MLDSHRLLPLHQKITSHQRLEHYGRKTTKYLKEKNEKQEPRVRMERSCWLWSGV